MNTEIKITGLRKAYGKKQALCDVNLCLKAGSIVGLLGPNGSGKTTLMRILAGLEKNFLGHITFHGNALSNEIKNIVSFLPDRISLPLWMSVNDAVGLYVNFFENFDRGRCLDLLRRLEMDFSQKIGNMSKGTQEKLQIILAMCRRAKVYLLDEPLGGVDPATRDIILDIILDNYAEDSLVLLATHLIGDVERIFDQVIFLKDGAVERFQEVDVIRQTHQKSVDELFREVFKC